MSTSSTLTYRFYYLLHAGLCCSGKTLNIVVPRLAGEWSSQMRPWWCHRITKWLIRLWMVSTNLSLIHPRLRSQRSAAAIESHPALYSRNDTSHASPLVVTKETEGRNVSRIWARSWCDPITAHHYNRGWMTFWWPICLCTFVARHKFISRTIISHVALAARLNSWLPLGAVNS